MSGRVPFQTPLLIIPTQRPDPTRLLTEADILLTEFYPPRRQPHAKSRLSDARHRPISLHIVRQEIHGTPYPSPRPPL
ncbi:hypothetical protein Agabi119p4_4848 [Agaricus bisporus var. burnettii]|uniref:Uncharacterized protein n=1 Tax=Agaricus bisporus var. burnettii TaxID=192524 RepID=A0A8H7F474_AGABI|nr:hypothetical protein Agabi119p4_4848 [Agaricus bisporus var. burnettii]